MKRIITVLCLAIITATLFSTAAVAENSSANGFLSNLSANWGSLLKMTSEAAGDLTALLEGSDLQSLLNGAEVPSWVRDAKKDFSAWYTESNKSEWTESTAAGLRSLIGQYKPYIEKYIPVIQAGLTQVDEDVRNAYNTLMDADVHTTEELKKAFDTMVDAAKKWVK